MTRDSARTPPPDLVVPLGAAPGRAELHRHRGELERRWLAGVPDGGVGGADAGADDGAADGWSEGGNGGAAAGAVSSEVAASWARSSRRVDPASAAAPATDADWRGSVLRAPLAGLEDELRRIAEDSGYVAAVTDEHGTILRTYGGRHMRDRAEHLNFAPGGRWSEDAMGTNALGLSLRTGRPSSVFAAEHYVAALHDWVCYCAPLRAPDGRVLGVLDLSTTWDRSHPLAFSTVRLLAATVETRLAAEPPGRAPDPRGAGAGSGGGRRAGAGRAGAPGRTDRSRPPTRAAEPGGSLRIRALEAPGRAPSVQLGGVEVTLRPRQWEILVLLALTPGGWAGERLQDALYGERQVGASTFKAEASHLRRALGGRVAPRSYALTGEVGCDAAEVLAALERGDTATAAARYTGPLLPRSEAPGVVEWRRYLEAAVREAVLADGTPQDVLRLGAVLPHDVRVQRRALQLLGPHDPRRALAAARLHTGGA